MFGSVSFPVSNSLFVLFYFFLQPFWPLCCEILFFLLKMSALSASGVSVLIEYC